MITPNGIVYLLNVPLDKSQQNQIRFASRSAQSAYFAALAVHTYSDVTFTRKDSMIKVPAHIDTLWNCNYVMYNNIDRGSRYFYAFIDRMEWLSENSTAVFIKTDVYQTWMQDCDFRRSFVIREHVTDDTIGLHTLPENLETGDYIKASQTDFSELDALAIIVMISADTGVVTPGDPPNRVIGRIYNGVFSGLAYVPFYGTGYITALRNFLDSYNDFPDRVVGMFTYPAALIPYGSTSGETMASDSTLSTFEQIAISINSTTINGYTPKNNKLFCWPFNMLHVTNLQGQSMDIRLELFDDGYPENCTFTAKGVMIPGAKVICTPVNYKVHEASNYEEALTLGNYPLCSWTSDAWSQWIAANAISLGAGATGSALSIATSAATGQPMGAASGILGVAQSLGSVYQAWTAAPHVNGNVGNGSVNVAVGAQHYTFNQLQIRAEYAQIIDDYFSMYGYKVNRVKIPELASRPYWNYVQTSGANITGDIPQEDLRELKALFDTGITLWHSGANVANYSLDNSLA